VISQARSISGAGIIGLQYNSFGRCSMYIDSIYFICLVCPQMAIILTEEVGIYPMFVFSLLVVHLDARNEGMDADVLVIISS
jgi:hypothetical protein